MENLDNKAIDIIIYLAQYVKSNQGKVGNLVNVFRDLRELGFSEEEIKRAYLWFLNKLPRLSKTEKEKGNLYGWLRGCKDKYFSEESYGFLYQMEELGLLGKEEMQILIKRSLALGREIVELQTIKSLANQLFFSHYSPDSITTELFWIDQEGI